ncbi:MAG: type II secretion system protein [Patescibacteria group bacterium]|jgi:prepilin-type N-terminal cleavage/methylation domain-containing protein
MVKLLRMQKPIFKTAFTLVELLVVIAIIGILATLAIVAIQNTRKNARDTKRMADIKQIQTALELYFNDNGSYPVSSSVTSTIRYGGKVYMEVYPQAPTPPDGNCDEEANQYVYTEVGADNGSYNLSFCIGSQTGNISPGNKSATPIGILERDSAELTAIIARAEAEGFTLPSVSTLRQVDILIGAMKTSGFWDEQDLILNFAYNNTDLANFSRINWKNPSDPLAVRNGGLTYGVYGELGNGSNAHIDTNNNPSTYGGNYTLNDAGRGAVIFSAGSVIDGTANASINSLRNGNLDAHKINQLATTALSPSADLSGVGYKGVNRDDATNVRFYNKATELNGTANSSSLYNGNQYLMRRGGTYSSIGISFYHLGGSISQTITQNFRIAYNAYLVSIGLTAIA